MPGIRTQRKISYGPQAGGDCGGGSVSKGVTCRKTVLCQSWLSFALWVPILWLVSNCLRSQRAELIPPRELWTSFLMSALLSSTSFSRRLPAKQKRPQKALLVGVMMLWNLHLNYCFIESVTVSHCCTR